MLLAACDQPPVKQTAEETLSEVGMYGNIVKVRNCEYIKASVYSGYVYTHCGDCTNPIHQKQ